MTQSEHKMDASHYNHHQQQQQQHSADARRVKWILLLLIGLCCCILSSRVSRVSAVIGGLQLEGNHSQERGPLLAEESREYQVKNHLQTPELADRKQYSLL